MGVGQNIPDKTDQSITKSWIMKNIFYLIALVLFVSCKEQQKSKNGNFVESGVIQLTAPSYSVDSVFFRKSSTIALNFRYPDAIIRYTTNGSDVSSSSPSYDKPIIIGNTSEINAKAFHPDFIESDQVTIKATKIGNNISDAIISVSPPPSKEYFGAGASTLVDLKKGTSKIRNVDTWLGFNATEVIIKAQFQEKMNLSKVTLSTFTSQGGWIFSPYMISIFSGTEQIGEYSNKDADKKEKTAMKMIEIPIEPNNEYKSIKIVVHALEQMPDWHPNKGSLPWFFIDEMIVE